MKLPVALTIAGSDSSGGAGIQADLKTFAALGVHGTSAITAITAQNTVTVSDILELPTHLIRAQIDRVVEDMRPAAVKTGMLGSPAVIETVAGAVQELGLDNLVVDPVMIAKSGARLLPEDAVAALRDRLLPLAHVITPNLPEAEVLLGRRVETLPERRQAARDLLRFGAAAVVVKGGHANGEPVDVYFDGGQLLELPGRRVPSRNTHGSGCAFAAAIAAGLARGQAPLDAVSQAKIFIQEAIEAGLELGRGSGPVNPTFQARSSTRADQAKSPAP